MQKKIINFTVSFLGRFTMYRSMVYFLALLSGTAILASALGFLPYNAFDIFLQTTLFVAVCWIINFLIAKAFKASTNVESSIITALILANIVGPLSLPEQWLPLVFISFAAIASKYLLVVRKSHVFNPAAFGIFVSALFIGFPASWWVGGFLTLPVILAGGLFMTVKIKRFPLVLSFFGAYAGLTIIRLLLEARDPALLLSTFISGSFLFFVFIMLTEPLTSPQTKKMRMGFGALTGSVLFLLQTLAPHLPYSIELSLLTGNLFAAIVVPKFQQLFTLRHREKFSSYIEGFWFRPKYSFFFKPGQFLEYTLPHAKHDSRGVRRFFTIASAPSEEDVLLVSKFHESGSSFKRALRKMKVGDKITASRVGGDFVLPNNTSKKLVFIAGGIGVTPFRSMVKHLMEKEEKRDIILLYSARSEGELVFKDLFEDAAQKLGIKNVYVISNKEKEQNNKPGTIDYELIRKEIPDFKERVFFVSGPEVMVRDVRKTLKTIGVRKKNIKRDYFTGY